MSGPNFGATSIYTEDYIKARSTVLVNECWEWLGPLDNKGYGQVSRISSGESLAHRLSWKIFKRQAAGDINVCHTCDNPRCVNPDHLFLGTQKDNVRDAVKKGRNYIPKSRITQEAAKDIAERLRRGEKQRDIAKLHGISESHLSNIKNAILKGE